MVAMLVAFTVAGTAATAATACHTASRPPGRPAPPSGTLTTPEARALVEDYEGRLAAAYAAGDASRLSEFLAGSELRGNAATIGVLNGRHQRNIFHVQVDDVSIASTAKDRVVVALRDHTTEDYFVDASTGETLNGGLPGPESQAFTIILDRNPGNGRWYWTGAQKRPE